MNTGNLPTTTIYAIYPSLVVPYTITSTRFVLPPPPPVLPMIYMPAPSMQPSQHPLPQFIVEQRTIGPLGQHLPALPVQYLPAQVLHNYPVPAVHHYPAPLVHHHPTPVVEQLPVPDHDDTSDSAEVDQTDSSGHVSIQEISNEPLSTPQDVSASTTNSSEPPQDPETPNATDLEPGPSRTDKWTCRTCSLKLQNKAELYRHKQNVHGDWGPFNQNGQRSSRRFSYQNRVHQVVYPATPPFPCRLCHKTGYHREYLDAHLRQYHRVEIPNDATYRRLFY